jgi:S1-C subfamily serine protease
MYLYKTEGMVPNFAFALQKFIINTIDECVPHLRADFPPLGQFDFEIGSDHQICLVAMVFKTSGIPTGGQMKPDRFEELKQIVNDLREFSELRALSELKDSFGWDRFVLALDVVEDAVDWNKAQARVVDWLNELPLRRALKHNLDRVQAAIPSPPQYSLARVQKALWVLECEEAMVQGSAFEIERYGFVTNDHVVRPAKAMVAFQVDDINTRYPVRIVAQNAALDLAIIDIVGADGGHALEIELDEAVPMDHVAVCGFPNYRLGDSGVLVPGLIIGSRPRSGVRRLLTNASIVVGMSGGPAISANGKAVGVCVTGADTFSSASETEDHSIIPISALERLEANCEQLAPR